jgi:hypothetical protein
MLTWRTVTGYRTPKSSHITVIPRLRAMSPVRIEFGVHREGASVACEDVASAIGAAHCVALAWIKRRNDRAWSAGRCLNAQTCNICLGQKQKSEIGFDFSWNFTLGRAQRSQCTNQMEWILGHQMEGNKCRQVHEISQKRAGEELSGTTRWSRKDR